MGDKAKPKEPATSLKALTAGLEHALKKTDFEIDSDITVHPLVDRASFTLLLGEDKPLTFDKLDWVAETFKTDKIDVRRDERTHALSDVTFENYGVLLLDVKFATIPDVPEPPKPFEGLEPKRGYIIVAGGPVLASAWARGRQCKKDEAFFYENDDDIDHLPRKLYKIVYVGPMTKKKDEQVVHLKKMGFEMLEEV